MKATDATPDADGFLRQALSDPESGFSIGVSGAIAEFMRCDGDAEIRREGGAHVATTRGGAMRVALISGVTAVAAETPSRKREYWQQQVAFCLDRARARMAARAVLTEIGPDRDAVDDQAREQILFDLGLGLPHVDACVRTADADLIALLRRCEGRPLLSDAPEARDAIVARSPPRVFCSRLGRIEVYSPIPERKTPEGPHTHLLPKLLGQPSGIADFIPDGLVSCLEVYPANPLRRLNGEARNFDRERHRRFQRLLKAWGPPEYVDEKQRLTAWLSEGRALDAYPRNDAPLAAMARQVTPRQLAQDNSLTPSKRKP